MKIHSQTKKQNNKQKNIKYREECNKIERSSKHIVIIATSAQMDKNVGSKSTLLVPSQQGVTPLDASSVKWSCVALFSLKDNCPSNW